MEFYSRRRGCPRETRWRIVFFVAMAALGMVAAFAWGT
jgi:hypothetical protein